MAIDLSNFDIEEFDGSVARLTDKLDWRDLQESQNCLMSVQYNEIDLGRTPYHFNQPFVGNEANLYFQRMKEFSELSVNYIVEHSDHKSHFFRTDIRGNIKKIFDLIDPRIAKARRSLSWSRPAGSLFATGTAPAAHAKYLEDRINDSGQHSHEAQEHREERGEREGPQRRLDALTHTTLRSRRMTFFLDPDGLPVEPHERRVAFPSRFRPYS